MLPGTLAWPTPIYGPVSCPIVATSDKYVTRYWPNAKGLPLYFVAGQMDSNKIASNARDVDRYLERAGFDAIYVEYQGRGHEHFHDEILRIFDWMGRYRRDFNRKEFECVSDAPWDQFFWWLELDGYPERSIVLPINWPGSKATIARTEARISEKNGIYIKTAASDVVLYLKPDLVNFDERISINGKKVDVAPDVEVLLEDARTARRSPAPVLGEAVAVSRTPTLAHGSKCTIIPRSAGEGDASDTRRSWLAGGVRCGAFGRTEMWAQSMSLLSKQPAVNQPSSSLRTNIPAGPRYRRTVSNSGILPPSICCSRRMPSSSGPSNRFSSLPSSVFASGILPCRISSYVGRYASSVRVKTWTASSFEPIFVSASETI